MCHLCRKGQSRLRRGRRQPRRKVSEEKNQFCNSKRKHLGGLLWVKSSQVKSSQRVQTLQDRGGTVPRAFSPTSPGDSRGTLNF